MQSLQDAPVGTVAPLRTITFGELADLPVKPRQHLLFPWLREGDSALVWAAAGVGKTMFTLSLALAVAGGGTVLEWNAPRPRRVLVIDGEMPEDDLRERLISLAGSVEGIDMDAARKNLRLLARNGQSPDAAFPDFGDVSQHRAILRRIRRYRPDLVVLDNLSTLAGVADENSAAATQVIVKFLAMLKQAQIATIVVHHSNKAGTGYRGSTMLETTFECVIGLRKDRGADVVDTSGTTKFRFEWTKYRRKRGPTIRDTSARLEDAGGRLQWVVAPTDDDILDALAALVRTGQYGTQRALLAALPRHLWPTAGSQPSLSWLNGKLGVADAKGVLPGHEREKLFKASRGESEAPADVDEDDTANDDL